MVAAEPSQGPPGCVPDRFATVEFGELPEPVERLLELVDAVPPGRVTSYGRLAATIDDLGPRKVGSMLARYGALTCWWRVVGATGRLPPELARRAEPYWRAEGTPFVTDPVPRIVMRTAAWEPPGGTG